jgi:hypothetical protein
MKSFATVTTPIVLPWPVRSGLEGATRALFDLRDQFIRGFLAPCWRVRACVARLSMWSVFKNPPSLFIGGVAHFRDGGGSIDAWAEKAHP